MNIYIFPIDWQTEWLIFHNEGFRLVNAEDLAQPKVAAIPTRLMLTLHSQTLMNHGIKCEAAAKALYS